MQRRVDLFRIAVWVLLLWLPHTAWALADSVRVSLVVMSPGEAVYSALGHTALRLQSPSYDLDYCFTYGMDLRPQSKLRFLSGKAPAGYIVAPTQAYLQTYADEDRGVTEYEINLTLAEKRRLWQYLDQQVARGPIDNYDFMLNGCAQIVVRAINSCLWKSELRYGSLPDDLINTTRRERVHQALAEAPWADLFWMTIVGSSAEEPCTTDQQLVLPKDLCAAWQQATFVDSAGVARPVLVGEPKTLVAATAIMKAGILTPTTIALCLLLLALLLTAAEWRGYGKRVGHVFDLLLVLIHTLMAIVMTYLLVGSTLVTTEWNWLIIPYNLVPLLLWLFCRWRNATLPRWVTATGQAGLLLFLMATPWLPTITMGHLNFLTTLLIRWIYDSYQIHSLTNHFSKNN